MNSILCLLLLFRSISFANELSAIYNRGTLTNQTADWNDFSITASLQIKESRSLIIEAGSRSRFGEKGFIGGATFTQNYNDDWYQSFSLTDSTNTSILPGVTVFSEINRKLTKEKKAVVGLGFGHSDGKDPYHDFFMLGEVTIYFIPKLVTQTGVRYNQSQPGAVNSIRVFSAFTYNFTENLDLMYRIDLGNEGYQILSAGNFTNKVSSSDHYLQARYYFSKWIGTQAGLEKYENTNFSRNNYSVGLLYRF